MVVNFWNHSTYDSTCQCLKKWSVLEEEIETRKWKNHFAGQMTKIRGIGFNLTFLYEKRDTFHTYEFRELLTKHTAGFSTRFPVIPWSMWHSDKLSSRQRYKSGLGTTRSSLKEIKEAEKWIRIFASISYLWIYLNNTSLIFQVYLYFVKILH